MTGVSKRTILHCNKLNMEVKSFIAQAPGFIVCIWQDLNLFLGGFIEHLSQTTGITTKCDQLHGSDCHKSWSNLKLKLGAFGFWIWPKELQQRRIEIFIRLTPRGPSLSASHFRP
jgi:hypothetical protein